jgi:hypothetical protein
MGNSGVPDRMRLQRMLDDTAALYDQRWRVKALGYDQSVIARAEAAGG